MYAIHVKRNHEKNKTFLTVYAVVYFTSVLHVLYAQSGDHDEIIFISWANLVGIKIIKSFRIVF